jgi:hypothetical protein
MNWTIVGVVVLVVETAIMGELLVRGLTMKKRGDRTSPRSPRRR